jgi:hypothetical protein
MSKSTQPQPQNGTGACLDVCSCEKAPAGRNRQRAQGRARHGCALTPITAIVRPHPAPRRRAAVLCHCVSASGKAFVGSSLAVGRSSLSSPAHAQSPAPMGLCDSFVDRCTRAGCSRASVSFRGKGMTPQAVVAAIAGSPKRSRIARAGWRESDRCREDAEVVA